MKKIYFAFLSVGLCFTATAQDLSSTLTVSAGTSVFVSPGTTVYASEVNLKSVSNKFSSLFLDGALGASTIVNYDRYVNVVGVSGIQGGNDLVSMPVKADGNVTFAQFLNYSADGSTLNSDIIPNNAPTNASLYAFGPFDNTNYTKTSGAYTNYNATTDGSTILTRGKGYRAASKTGQTIRFTGKVATGPVSIEITTNLVEGNGWNTVGNPYPTYLNSQAFLLANSDVMDPDATAIYGYNSTSGPSSGTIGNFTIINNLTNTDVNIAPGQGFLVANDPTTATNQINFTTAMRTSIGTDDFILGRGENQNKKLRLRASHDSGDFATEIYFNANSSLGLDPGYDASLFGGIGYSFMLYSHLVENSHGQKLAIQSLGGTDLNDIVIPLGIKTLPGKKITFSIQDSSLPEEIQVYLEDKQTNTFTLLNAKDYTFTSEEAISGTGRFFLRMENRLLSSIDQEYKSLQIFSSEQKLVVNGQLLADTTLSIYDIQGRAVLISNLKVGSEKNTIDTSNLSRGIYVIKLINAEQYQTKKVIIN